MRNVRRPGSGVPRGLLDHLLGVSGVRPGVVDSARRRLTLAPLPPSRLLAASVVEVLVDGRCPSSTNRGVH